MYTLGPIEDVPVTPVAPTVPSSLQPLPTKPGPERGPRVTKTARMRTGPLPPHLKERVLAAMAKARPPQAATTSGNSFVVEPAPVETLPIAMPEVDTPQVQINGPGVIAIADHAPETAPIPDDCTSAFTGFDSDYVDIEMDDMVQMNDPWEVMEHPTGGIIVDDNSGVSFSAAEMDIGMLPRLGTLTLTETEAPTLLFKDDDVRPGWLMSAVKEFLRFTPYYGGLGQVIDQFLLQEARLGYPNLVLIMFLLTVLAC